MDTSGEVNPPGTFGVASYVLWPDGDYSRRHHATRVETANASLLYLSRLRPYLEKVQALHEFHARVRVLYSVQQYGGQGVLGTEGDGERVRLG